MGNVGSALEVSAAIAQFDPDLLLFIGIAGSLKPDDLRYYLNCCASCYANDEPGMARFERMRDMMGAAFALEHA